jgi:disulfide bond formation protein DsbB
MVSVVNQILGVLTIASQIIFGAGLIYFLIYSRSGNNRLIKLLAEQGIAIAFFVALVATLSSLFYSQIAGFTPCNLCWYQRIFMYPQVILLGLAWLKKEKQIIDYSLILAFIGWIISLYYNYLGWGGAALTACATSSFVGISCLRRYVFEFGYITIPLMALSAFTLIILILGAQRILNYKH